MRCSGRLPPKVFGAALEVGVAANAAELKRYMALGRYS